MYRLKGNNIKNRHNIKLKIIKLKLLYKLYNTVQLYNTIQVRKDILKNKS